jgi:hypothetical protein
VGVVSIVARSWAPISLFILGLIVCTVYNFIKVPMVPANVETAKRQHVWALIGLLIILGWLVYDAL